MVVDPERSRDDSDETMSAVGMGAVYVSTSGKKALRILSDRKRERLLKEYYDPYHKRFEAITGKLISVFNKCLIVDMHSFPEKPLPYERNQDAFRPDICIGKDDYHTPKHLTKFADEYFSERSFVTALNTPFGGTFVPAKYYQKDERVSSIMIEIKRSLYVNENTGEKTQSFADVKDLIDGFIRKLTELI